MLPLTISYNYEIVYHIQKARESLKSPFPCCFDRFFSFLHFLMAYFSTKSEKLQTLKSLHKAGLDLENLFIHIHTNNQDIPKLWIL